MSRKHFTDAVEAIGAGLFTLGAALVYAPAGFMVAGILLVLGAYLAGGE